MSLRTKASWDETSRVAYDSSEAARYAQQQKSALITTQEPQRSDSVPPFDRKASYDRGVASPSLKSAERTDSPLISPRVVGHVQEPPFSQRVEVRRRRNRGWHPACILCAVVLVILVVLGIVIAVIIRRMKTPSGRFVGITLPNSAIDLPDSDGLDFNFDAHVLVMNPNFIGAAVSNVHIDILDPADVDQGYSTDGILSTGTLANVTIPANSITNITVPFTFALNSSDNVASLNDLVSELLKKCQIIGQDGIIPKLTLPYNATALVRILGVVSFEVKLANVAQVSCDLQLPNAIEDSLQATDPNPLQSALGAAATALRKLNG